MNDRLSILSSFITFLGASSGCAVDDDPVRHHEPTASRSDAILDGTLVTPSSSTFVNANRAIVGLDGINSSLGSLGTGLLVAPRLVLTASHAGRDGNCRTTGQSVEFGTDSQSPDEQIAVVGEIDFPSSCSLVSQRGCCAAGDNNIDVGLWVLEYPPTVAVPYWNPRSDVQLGEFVRRLGFGPSVVQRVNPEPRLLRFASCEVTRDTYSDPFNGSRFDSGACAFGAWGVGGDSGGPVFDADGKQVGIHIGDSSAIPSISMQLVPEYLTFIQGQIELHKSQLFIADFDGVGGADFFHWNRFDRGNWVDLNQGAWPDGGGDGAAEAWCAQELHVGDFNGDGRADLLCHDAPGQLLYLRYGQPSGQFSSTSTIASSWCGGEIYVGDFDGDHHDDLFCRDLGSGRKVKLNDKFGFPFSGNGSDWVENAGWCQGELFVARLDLDGRDDLLCRDPGVALEVRHALSSGALSSTIHTLPTQWCGQKMLVADFNNDDRDDLMCIDQAGDSVWIDYASAAPMPFAGNGDWDDLSYAFCDQEVQAADVDGDGYAEVVCHDPDSGLVWIDRTTTTWGGFDGVFDAKMPNIATPLWP